MSDIAAWPFIDGVDGMGQKNSGDARTDRQKKREKERGGEKKEKGKTLLTLLYDHKICMYDIGISICRR